ncbi:MAG: helix-turn-helix domain-containing protein [Desulfitobacteriaceae bacterium]
MLTIILDILADQGTRPLSELARQAGYSAGEIAAGLEQLAHMGYIEKLMLDQACGGCAGSGGSRGRPCGSCSVTSPGGTFPSWRITKKGENYLQKDRRG